MEKTHGIFGGDLRITFELCLLVHAVELLDNTISVILTPENSINTTIHHLLSVCFVPSYVKK